MNNKLLVIESKTSIFSDVLKCDKLEYNNQTRDEEIHSWLLLNRQLLAVANTLIIPVRLGTDDSDYRGLYIGMHIRLTKELEEVRFLPILFISDDTREDILLNQVRNQKEKSGLLLFTRGSYLISAMELDNYINENLKGLQSHNYQTEFHKHLMVSIPENFGNHAIANTWGVFQFAEVTGHSHILTESQLNKSFSTLYFKFLGALQSNATPQGNDKEYIESKDKNILLIDDEESNGWTVVLKNLFHESNFESVPQSDHFFEEALEKAIQTNTETGIPKWDLILLDLRLQKDEDLGKNAFKQASQYSGAQLLQKLKAFNKGIQIIFFTASDKAWNMRELIDLGADGYYTKESPLLNYNQDFTLANYNSFKSQVEKCFNKSFFREFYYNLNPLLDFLLSERDRKKVCLKFIQPGNIGEIYQQLLISISLLEANSTDLQWAFFNQVKIIEQIIKDFYTGTKDLHIVEAGFAYNVNCMERLPDSYIVKLSITPIKRENNEIVYKEGSYTLTGTDIAPYNKNPEYISFNFRLTCVLFHKYGLPLDESMYKYYDLYNKRSQIVAHATKSKPKISAQDLLLSIKLLKILIQ